MFKAQFKIDSPQTSRAALVDAIGRPQAIRQPIRQPIRQIKIASSYRLSIRPRLPLRFDNREPQSAGSFGKREWRLVA
jgi:hypothetical protein